MNSSIPPSVREAFEHLKASARVRWVEKERAFEVRCSRRETDPCTEASVRFLEAVVRDLPDVRLILSQKENEALEALGGRRLSTDTKKVQSVLDIPRSFPSSTWELPSQVDVGRLRRDVLEPGHYVILAGDPAASGSTLPRQDGSSGWMSTSRITFALSSDADDDTWSVWFRPEA